MLCAEWLLRGAGAASAGTSAVLMRRQAPSLQPPSRCFRPIRVTNQDLFGPRPRPGGSSSSRGLQRAEDSRFDRRSCAGDERSQAAQRQRGLSVSTSHLSSTSRRHPSKRTRQAHSSRCDDANYDDDAPSSHCDDAKHDTDALSSYYDDAKHDNDACRSLRDGNGCDSDDEDKDSDDSDDENTSSDSDDEDSDSDDDRSSVGSDGEVDGRQVFTFIARVRSSDDEPHQVFDACDTANAGLGKEWAETNFEELRDFVERQIIPSISSPVTIQKHSWKLSVQPRVDVPELQLTGERSWLRARCDQRVRIFINFTDPGRFQARWPDALREFQCGNGTC